MTIPGLHIDADGNISRMEPAARRLLGEHPGLYRALRAGSLLLFALDEGTGAAPREGESLALAGDLRAMSMLGLLNLLGQNRETGRLVIKRDQVERVIMLKAGDVASVGSNAPQDRLGRFLVRLGKVSEDQLDAAQRDADRSGRRIGQVLLSQGLLDAHELWSSIQTQITDIFTDVVGWSDGSFILYRLPEGFRFPSTPPLSMQGLLLEAVRRADEMGVFRERIRDRNVMLRPGKNPLPPDAGEFEREVYSMIQQGATVADVGRRLHLTEFDATHFCYQLMKRGCVEVAEAPKSEARFELTPEQQAKLEVYNLAFREIRDEVVRHGALERFMVGVMKYLSDPASSYAALFRGVAPDESGALPVDRLVKNLGSAAAPDPMALLQEALNELTFFMLFQCGELLDPQSDENLGRRVRLIHAALSGPK